MKLHSESFYGNSRRRLAVLCVLSLLGVAATFDSMISFPLNSRSLFAQGVLNTDARVCQVSAQRQVQPRISRYCESAKNVLSFDASCGAGLYDIVISIDNSGSMSPFWKNIKQEIVEFINELKLPNNSGIRVGIVINQVRGSTKILINLTNNSRQLIQTLRTWEEVVGVNNLPDAIVLADDMLMDGRKERIDNPIPIMILLGDGIDNNDTQYTRKADQAKSRGIHIMTVCYRPEVAICRAMKQNVSSGPESYFESSNGTFDLSLIADRLLTPQVTRLSVEDSLPPALAIVPGSPHPAPQALDPTSRSIRWNVPGPITRTLALSYTVRPSLPDIGTQVITGWVVYTDTLGRSVTQSLPDGKLTLAGPCVDPSTTPSGTPTPTATRTPTSVPTTTVTPPPSATVTPTSTALPRPIYLPITLHDICERRPVHADVVLVIDSSSSMTGRKLADAQSAALAFVGMMELAPGGDQVALVRFDATAEIVQPLAQDRAVIEAAIRGLGVRAGTRIDRGLQQAFVELQGPRHLVANTAVVVLLTDGVQSEGPAAALEAAAALRGVGVALYAIGLGADVDTATLQTMAGRPERYRFAPDSARLSEIYTQIAREIQCPATSVWPNRP